MTSNSSLILIFFGILIGQFRRTDGLWQDQLNLNSGVSVHHYLPISYLTPSLVDKVLCEVHWAPNNDEIGHRLNSSLYCTDLFSGLKWAIRSQQLSEGPPFSRY